ncbi:MAG TPA: hypothetical protein VGN42_16415, partial [Pirellulales bacterium]|nr:hypothetical protein [Pirellulales bacterium]
MNQGPDILFVNAPQLYIDALSGDDQVDVRAPAPNGAAWNTQVTIAGGAPAGQPGLNGDDFTLETPGANNHVTYRPTNVDGGVFSLTQTAAGADTTTVTLTSAPFTIPAINYTSSAGGFESAAYDGQGGNAALTIQGTGLGGDTIVHTAGGSNGAGAFQVNGLLALSYKSLSSAGTTTVNDTGADNTVVVDGTANNDAFTVDGASGTVHLNNRVSIAQTGVQNLVLNGYNPNNTFNLNAPLPYATSTVNSIDPATLNLTGTAGADAIVVDLTNSQITGFGGAVNYVGVAQVNLNGNGGADTLTVDGTVNDDIISYKPTSAAGGTFSQAGVPVTFNFSIGAGNLFTVLGGGGNGGDEVDVQGNNAGSVITVDSPNRRVTVENALNVVLMPVVLAPDVQVASVAGGIGNNTFLVIPARNVPAANDTVGPGFLMPNNLLVHINGGAVASNAALIVAGPGGATLSNNLFAVVNRTSNTSGVVRMFRSTGGPEPTQYPDISCANVGTIQASTAVNAVTHQQQTLTMGPDLSDPNGSLNNAAFLGSGASINATMQIQVYDAAGNPIANFGVNDTDSNQRRRIPA